MKNRCIIVDDEFLARKLLKDYTAKIPNLDLIGDFNSPLKASELILENKVDILFLDIQMPDITGLDFLRSLDNPPAVIITTAYKEYALDGFELNVIDYLLKPFTFERFFKAVNKATNHLSNPKETSSINENSFHKQYIIIKADRKHYKINYDDLIYIEGQKAYVTFFSKDNRRVTALASLKDLEEKLKDKGFMRIHKSYIVSISQIRTLEGNLVEIGEKQLPVGKSFKPNVNKLFGLES